METTLTIHWAVPMIDLPQEKLRGAFRCKTLKSRSWTSWGSGFELTARQRTGSIFFSILDKCPLLGRGSREFPGGQSEGARLLSTKLEQGPYPPVSVLHLRECCLLTATPQGRHTGVTTLNLCNNKLHWVKCEVSVLLHHCKKHNTGLRTCHMLCSWTLLSVLPRASIAACPLQAQPPHTPRGAASTTGCYPPGNGQ